MAAALSLIPMKLLIEIHHAGTDPPSHGRPVFGLDAEDGEAYVCYFDFDDGWKTATVYPEGILYWFEIPSVKKIDSDMMLTAVAEYEYEREGLADEHSRSRY